MARPPTQLRETILDAALALLRTKGERAMTQTGVAAAAGIPQGHLTYYFPKKRDLVVGVAERFAEVTSEQARAFFAERAGQPMREVLTAYVKRLIADRERTRMLLGLVVMSDREPALGAILQHNARLLRAMLGHTFGRSPDDPLNDLLLAMLWGLGIHGFVLQEERSDQLLEEVLRRFDTPS
ncbi:MAG: TetR family transcriptional regulator [Polyangiaceae bacterium]